MSDQTDIDREAIITLVDALCDETITDEQMAQFEATLSSSREARQFYHLQMGLHRDLEDQLEMENSTPTKTAPFPTAMLRVAAILILVVGAGWWLLPGPHSPLATVSALTEVGWTGETFEAGAQFGIHDRLTIASGLIQLDFPSGVVASLEGPADLEFTGEEMIFLYRGKFAAYVPEGAEGFRVLTASAEVIDLGTEFAVDADADGEMEIVVFEGEVDLVAGDEKRRVYEGNAFLVDKKGKTKRTPFFRNAFDRTRANLRNHQVIWDAFRAGETFPGEATAGWASPWKLEASGGVIDWKRTGISGGEELVSGSESFLQVEARADRGEEPLSLSLGRTFRSTGAVKLDAPYSTEFFIRLDSPGHLVFSGSQGWRIDTAEFDLLVGTTYRFAIAVHPERQTWRAVACSRGGPERLRNSLKGDLSSPTLLDGEQATLEIKALAPDGADLRYSLDAVRVWNFPISKK